MYDAVYSTAVDSGVLYRHWTFIHETPLHSLPFSISILSTSSPVITCAHLAVPFFHQHHLTPCLPREVAAVCAVVPAFVCPQQRQEREWRLSDCARRMHPAGCRGVEQHMWARMCCAYCFSSWPNPVGDALCDNLPGAEGHCRHVTFLDCRAQIEIRKRDGRHKSCIAQDRVQPHRHPIVDVIEVDLTC